MRDSSRDEELADSMRERHMSIPYPKERSDFGRAPAQFTDEGLTIAGHPVMQEFQREYMAKLAQMAAASGGDTLEIGYGMGLATEVFLKNPGVRSHTVVECHPDVVKRCLEEHREEIVTARLRLIVSYWEDAVALFADETFDGILFDTYPTTRDDVELSHFPFFPHAHRLLRSGGALTYYSDEPVQLPAPHRALLHEAGFDTVDEEVFTMPKQDNPLYWQASGIVAPAARKH